MSVLIAQAIIIALGNFAGILTAYMLLDRKIDRKIAKYLKRGKESPEGQDLIAILKETRRLLKSPEAKEILTSLNMLLKKVKEKAEEAEEEDEDEEALELPKIETRTSQQIY